MYTLKLIAALAVLSAIIAFDIYSGPHCKSVSGFIPVCEKSE